MKNYLSSRLAVTILTTSFPVEPGLISGIFIEKLVRYLGNWAEVIVVAPAYVNTEREVPVETSYRLHCFRYGPKLWQRIAHSPGGIPAALSRNPLNYLLLPPFFGAMLLACYRASRSVSLIHANWSINGLIAGFAGRIVGVPVVTTLRGSDVNRARMTIIDRLMLKACLVLNRKIVTVSDAIRIRLEKEFPSFSEKLVTIPNGVDESLLHFPISQKSFSTLRLVSVGNLVSNKGFATIIEAVHRLLDHSLHLRIIGDGADKHRLMQITAAYGLSSNICFEGALAPDRVVRELHHSDIFVLASFSEGRPNVVLEAMAVGIPVIASDLEGIRELVEDGVTGLLFEPGDSSQLARCIGRLRSDSALRRKLAEAARDFVVREGLLWSETARKYANLYREIVANQDTACAA